MINPYYKCGPCPYECGLKTTDGTERCGMNRCMRDYNVDGQVKIKDTSTKTYLGDYPVKPSTARYQ